MTLPPFEAGAVQEMEDEAFWFDEAVTEVGAAGAVAGMAGAAGAAEFDEAEVVPTPEAFAAVTVKV